MKNVRHINNRQDGARIEKNCVTVGGIWAETIWIKTQEYFPYINVYKPCSWTQGGKDPPKSIYLPLLSSILDWGQAILECPLDTGSSPLVKTKVDPVPSPFPAAASNLWAH